MFISLLSFSLTLFNKTGCMMGKELNSFQVVPMILSFHQLLV